MKGLLFGFLVLIVFLVFIIPPVFIYQECKYNETFTDKINSIYEEWTKELKYLKNKFEIGLPSGILKYKKNQKLCPDHQNLLIQQKVAFRPTKHDDGCTYVDLSYPQQ